MMLSDLIPFNRLDRGLWWGKAWSLVTGCTPVSTGCDNCWLASMEKRFGGSGGKLVKGGKRSIRIHPERLSEPAKRKKPTVYAIWSDLFHESVPTDFIGQAYQTMFTAPQHIYLLLTKRPERMAKVFYTDGVQVVMPLSNVWHGTTAENQKKLDRRLPYLMEIPGRKFLSLEPLLGPIKIGKWIRDIDWVIAGCESGPRRRWAEREWFIKLLSECEAAGEPFFLKQTDVDGKIVHGPRLFGQRWLQTPEV